MSSLNILIFTYVVISLPFLLPVIAIVTIIIMPPPFIPSPLVGVHESSRALFQVSFRLSAGGVALVRAARGVHRR
jgi:hypothetical protein